MTYAKKLNSDILSRKDTLAITNDFPKNKTTDVKDYILDLVNHPKHYTSHPSGVECIQITEHMGFNLGNAVKYIWRAGLKNDKTIQDLEKAKFYIEREIKRLSK